MLWNEVLPYDLLNKVHYWALFTFKFHWECLFQLQAYIAFSRLPFCSRFRPIPWLAECWPHIRCRFTVTAWRKHIAVYPRHMLASWITDGATSSRCCSQNTPGAFRVFPMSASRAYSLLTRSSATAKSTVRPSCLLVYFMTFIGRQTTDQQLINHLYETGHEAYRIPQNNANNGHYNVQGRSRSPILVPIENPYATSYYWLILTNLLILRRFQVMADYWSNFRYR